MDVLNMNQHSIQVRMKAPDGKPDYATVQARRRCSLPEGYVVDTNWQAQTPGIKTFESSQSRTPLQLAPAPTSNPVQRISTLPVTPAPAPAPSADGTETK
jgi:hypothetical protein